MPIFDPSQINTLSQYFRKRDELIDKIALAFNAATQEELDALQGEVGDELSGVGTGVAGNAAAIAALASSSEAADQNLQGQIGNHEGRIVTLETPVGVSIVASALVDASAPSLIVSTGFSGVSSPGVGRFVLSFSTGRDNGNYIVLTTVDVAVGTSRVASVVNTTRATTGFEVRVADMAGSAANNDFSVAVLEVT